MLQWCRRRRERTVWAEIGGVGSHVQVVRCGTCRSRLLMDRMSLRDYSEAQDFCRKSRLFWRQNELTRIFHNLRGMKTDLHNKSTFYRSEDLLVNNVWLCLQYSASRQTTKELWARFVPLTTEREIMGKVLWTYKTAILNRFGSWFHGLWKLEKTLDRSKILDQIETWKARGA